MAAVKSDLPGRRFPMADANGGIAKVWYDWFQSLHLRTGGNPVDKVEEGLALAEENEAFSAQTVQPRTADLSARVAVLEAQCAMGMRYTDALQRIAALEALVAQFLPHRDGYSSVASITGTANQIVASASRGDVTLSLPQSIATTSAVQLASLGLGMVPSNIFDITQSGANAGSNIKLLNGNVGNAAYADLILANGTSQIDLACYGSGFTTSGMTRQDGASLAGSGAGGLTLRTTAAQPIYIGVNDTEVAQFTATRFQSSLPIRFKGYTVATLPAGMVGDNAYVTDAIAPTFLAAVVGGGGIVTPVFYNGAAWVGA